MRVAINLSKNKIKYLNVRKTDELQDNLALGEQDDLGIRVGSGKKPAPGIWRGSFIFSITKVILPLRWQRLLSKNESTVRSLLKRAREKLKAVLKEVYDFEE